MTEVVQFGDGGYRYLKAGFQFSSGVAAEPGFEMERARFLQPLPLAEGFAAVEAHLRAIGRPSTAFAACELRSPQPFTEQGFYEFNKQYVVTLERWGVFREGANPVARTNVCPEYLKPSQPSLYAFSYTVPARNAAHGSFVIAGGAERGSGKGSMSETVVRYGDTSADAMREKLRYIFDSMEARLAALGFTWKDAASTQAYTVHDIGALVGPELAARGAAQGGVTWHYTRPPVIGLEVELDVRAVARELLL
jgi:hypothetical protein